VIVSLLLAPNRGLLWGWVRAEQGRRRLHTDAVLADLYALAMQHAELEHGHPTAALEAMHPGAHHELGRLAERGFARREAAGGWTITPAGIHREEERREMEGEGR
jgi:manganese/zinc/iron transport system permease protein